MGRTSVKSSRTGGVIALVAAVVTSLLGVAGAADAADPTVDVPISFTVVNSNRSAIPCQTDGATYTIQGHLTGPASELAAGAHPDGTLYLHGLEVAEWFWRDAVTGPSYVDRMASLGDVSVTIDRLGYGASGHPAGLKSCVGGQADIAHQVVQQLRAGTYAGSIHPAFAKVALAGHSLGGAIAEIEAFSFHDVDGVAVLSYADLAPTPAVLLESLHFGLSCLLGGSPSAGAPGYAYLTGSVADFQRSFLAHAPEVQLAALTAHREINPCGDLLSIVSALPLDVLHLAQVKAPVLVMSGSQDQIFDATRVRLQAHLFLGSPSVTTDIVTGATHGFTLEPTVTGFEDEMHGWLAAHGL